MWRKKLCVPAGVLAHWIAGEVPSPGAAPGAAWLNFTGIWPPSGNPVMVRVIAGAGGCLAGGFCASANAEAERTKVVESTSRRMFVIMSQLGLWFTWLPEPV